MFVPAAIDGSRAEQRILEAAALLPSYGGVTGWAALRWCGGSWFGGGATVAGSLPPVTLAVGSYVRAQPGVRICEEGLDPRDLSTHDGLRITVPVRSACFEARYASRLRKAVEVLDMVAFSDLASVDEMWAYALRHASWTGIPQCREALAFAEENSWSPQETQTRLVWMLDAGLPRPLCNVPVFDRSGRHIGTPDLLDPEAGVVGEYDGALHLVGAQRARDVRRQEEFRRVGLEYFTVMAGDLPEAHRVVARMHAARRRARWLAESARPWTLDPPHWWVPTTTVDQRRALTAYQRQQWLRYRAPSPGSVG